MSRFAKAHEIAPNFFRRLNRQRVTGIIFERVEQNSDDFAFQIQKWSATLTALRRQIHSQVFGWKISAETFAVETGDHAKAWGLGQIDKEAGAGELAVLSSCLDFDYSFGAAPENIFDFAAKRRGGFRCLLRRKRSGRGEKRESCQQA